MASATAYLYCCQILSWITGHSQVDLSSGLVKSIVPHYKLIIRSGKLSDMRYIILDPAV
jgi:hypothetical protein